MTKINLETKWSDINWKIVEKNVFNIQKKIYKFSKINDSKQVYRYQKLLITSLKSKLLAVRKITQDNSGKKTAGVDGIKSLLPKERWSLAKKIKIDGTTKSIKRIFIPKSNGELRSLGIPTMEDRAKQQLVLLVLEPQWEAKFDPNSYGFRPGRSCHDAIEAVYKSINRLPKYVLDCDIEKCFDKIAHKPCLKN